MKKNNIWSDYYAYILCKFIFEPTNSNIAGGMHIANFCESIN